jgi:tetratricopeptide (TPR) repeat protein
MSDIPRAIEDLVTAIETNPTSRYVYDDLAQIYMNVGEYELALARYTEAIEVARLTHPYYYVSRGVAHGRLGKFDLQLADYEKALELDPNYAWAYNNLGYFYYEQKEYDKAVYYYKSAIEKDDSLINPYKFLTECYLETDKYDDAIRTLDIAIKKFGPDGMEFIRRKIYVHNDFGKLTDAIETAENYMEQNPGDKSVYHMIVALCFFSGDYDKALDWGRIALASEPGKYKSRILSAIADVYRNGLKDYPSAIRYYTKSILEEESDYALFYRAQCYDKNASAFSGSNRTQQVYMKIVKSLLQKESGKSTLSRLYLLSRTYLAAKDHKNAKVYAEKIFENAPKSREFYNKIPDYAYYLKFLLAVQAGETEQALYFIDEAIKIRPTRQYLDERKETLRAPEKGKGNGGFFKVIKDFFN